MPILETPHLLIATLLFNPKPRLKSRGSSSHAIKMGLLNYLFTTFD